jgi:hypothetical protein
LDGAIVCGDEVHWFDADALMRVKSLLWLSNARQVALKAGAWLDFDCMRVCVKE